MTPRAFATAFATLIAVSGPAWAQEALCGRQNVFWFDGAEDLSAAAEPLDMATVVPLRGSAVAAFRLGSAASVRVEAKGASGGDPKLELLAESGARLLQDDDGGEELGARAETELDPGTYCLAVEDVDGGLLSVQLRAGLTSHPALMEASSSGEEDAPTCDGLPVEDIALDASVSLEMEITDPRALWFDMPAGGGVMAELTGRGNDPLMALFDEDGELLAESDDADGLNAWFEVASPEGGGRACLRVDTYENDGSSVSLRLEPRDAAQVALAAVLRGEISPMPGSDVPVEDLGTVPASLLRELDLAKDHQWFSLDLDRHGLAVIEVLQIGESDPKVVLFDEAGRELGRNDDKGPGSLDARIIEKLPAGRYFLGIGAVEDSLGRVRVVIEQYDRRQ